MTTAHDVDVELDVDPDISAELLGFAERVATEAIADAHEDFDRMWAAGHKMLKPGGTRESDRNIFVKGAAYGVAWAARNLVYGPDGDVQLSSPESLSEET